MFQTMEECIKDAIENGYIDKDLTPLKCQHCGSSDFKDLEYWEDNFIVEIDRSCKSCGKKVGVWSYGHWQP